MNSDVIITCAVTGDDTKVTRNPHCPISPEQIADFMQAWLQGGACDGFIMQALQFPVELELFVDQVVPLLQRRGLQRRDYAGATLRDHLALAKP